MKYSSLKTVLLAGSKMKAGFRRIGSFTNPWKLEFMD